MVKKQEKENVADHSIWKTNNISSCAVVLNDTQKKHCFEQQQLKYSRCVRGACPS